MKKAKEKKRPVTVFLNDEHFDRLTEICKSRRQSRADFLRGAIKVDKKVPVLRTRPLAGACLERHLKRLQREKRERQKKAGRIKKGRR